MDKSLLIRFLTDKGFIPDSCVGPGGLSKEIGKFTVDITLLKESDLYPRDRDCPAKSWYTSTISYYSATRRGHTTIHYVICYGGVSAHSLSCAINQILKELESRGG